MRLGNMMPIPPRCGEFSSKRWGEHFRCKRSHLSEIVVLHGQTVSRLLIAIAHLPCDLLHLLAKRFHLFGESRVDDRQALLKTLKYAQVN